MRERNEKTALVEELQEKIILPNKLQKEMIRFFLRTSIPRIKREQEGAREEKYFCGVLACGECKGKFTAYNYTNKPGESKCRV